jgi:hypothetical protein
VSPRSASDPVEQISVGVLAKIVMVRRRLAVLNVMSGDLFAEGINLASTLGARKHVLDDRIVRCLGGRKRPVI